MIQYHSIVFSAIPRIIFYLEQVLIVFGSLTATKNHQMPFCQLETHCRVHLVSKHVGLRDNYKPTAVSEFPEPPLWRPFEASWEFTQILSLSLPHRDHHASVVQLLSGDYDNLSTWFPTSNKIFATFRRIYTFPLLLRNFNPNESTRIEVVDCASVLDERKPVFDVYSLLKTIQLWVGYYWKRILTTPSRWRIVSSLFDS